MTMWEWAPQLLRAFQENYAPILAQWGLPFQVHTQETENPTEGIFKYTVKIEIRRLSATGEYLVLIEESFHKADKKRWVTVGSSLGAAITRWGLDQVVWAVFHNAANDIIADIIAEQVKRYAPSERVKVKFALSDGAIIYLGWGTFHIPMSYIGEMPKLIAMLAV
jgi:hypothetical protein